MEIYEPTMPTESIKIKFVGYLLRDAARRWYDTRKRTLETETNQIVGMPSPRHSLFDSQIVRRSGETTPSSKLLEYDGSIRDYLTRFEELNSRLDSRARASRT